MFPLKLQNPPREMKQQSECQEGCPIGRKRAESGRWVNAGVRFSAAAMVAVAPVVASAAAAAADWPI